MSHTSNHTSTTTFEDEYIPASKKCRIADKLLPDLINKMNIMDNHHTSHHPFASANSSLYSQTAASSLYSYTSRQQNKPHQSAHYQQNSHHHTDSHTYTSNVTDASNFDTEDQIPAQDSIESIYDPESLDTSVAISSHQPHELTSILESSNSSITENHIDEKSPSQHTATATQTQKISIQSKTKNQENLVKNQPVPQNSLNLNQIDDISIPEDLEETSNISLANSNPTQQPTKMYSYSNQNSPAMQIPENFTRSEHEIVAETKICLDSDSDSQSGEDDNDDDDAFGDYEQDSEDSERLIISRQNFVHQERLDQINKSRQRNENVKTEANSSNYSKKYRQRDSFTIGSGSLEDISKIQGNLAGGMGDGLDLNFSDGNLNKRDASAITHGKPTENDMSDEVKIRSNSDANSGGSSRNRYNAVRDEDTLFLTRGKNQKIDEMEI